MTEWFRRKTAKIKTFDRKDIEKGKWQKCTNCGEIARPHHVCQSCGYYNGRQILKIRTDEVSE